MKEPTMTEIEREAAYYVECYAEHFDPHLEPEQRAELNALFAKALSTHSRPPAGFVRDEHGVDRRVLGTLPVTADGVIVLPGAKVWPHSSLFVCNVPENTEWTADEESATVALRLRAECDIEDWDVTKCYSTPEAAAEKERGQ